MTIVFLLIATSIGTMIYDAITTMPHMNVNSCFNVKEQECSSACSCGWCYFNSTMPDVCFSIDSELERYCENNANVKPMTPFCIKIIQESQRNNFIMFGCLAGACLLIFVFAICNELAKNYHY